MAELMTGEQKQRQWQRLAERVRHYSRGVGRLSRISEAELLELIDGYQSLIADLARARAMGASRKTIDQLNRLAVAGHNLLYGRGELGRRRGPGLRRLASSFARAVRGGWWAVLLSATLFFGPAIICYIAVQLHPQLGFDLVPPSFYDFSPTSSEHLHEIPQLARPIASSAIIANNVQVTLLAFGLGLTLGIGTSYVLIYNGVYLGAIASWMQLQGHARSFWGWVMPHGGVELLAITLAGAAGFLLAGAILAPGQSTRLTALRRAAPRALVIELGCMVMLLCAGLIEGFVSPSSIGYPARIAVLVGSLLLWLVYFAGAGLAGDATSPAPQPASR